MLTLAQEWPVSCAEIAWELVAWSIPHYTRGQVDKAGKALAPLSGRPRDFDNPFQVYNSSALEIVNDWRSSHTLPLYVTRTTLERRAKKLNASAVVAHRIKRLRSIEKKLEDNRYRNLRLTQIEDVGGCRAVLPTIEDTLALATQYSRQGTKSELIRIRDYIREPKEDGYRSIHLVYKYPAIGSNIASSMGIESKFRSVPNFSTHGQPQLRCFGLSLEYRSDWPPDKS